MNKEEPVLVWWKKWSITYIKLNILAKSLFGIPASFCTSEKKCLVLLEGFLKNVDKIERMTSWMTYCSSKILKNVL